MAYRSAIVDLLVKKDALASKQLAHVHVYFSLKLFCFNVLDFVSFTSRHLSIGSKTLDKSNTDLQGVRRRY